MDRSDPLVEGVAAAFVHQLGEGAEVAGCPVEGGAPGEQGFQVLALVIVEGVGAAGEPAGHLTHGWWSAGRSGGWEGLAQAAHVLPDHCGPAAVAECGHLLEQDGGVGAPVLPSLVEVGFVGVEDAGAAGPPSDQQFVGGGCVGQATHGVAGEAQITADLPRPPAFGDQGVDGGVLLAHPVRQSAGGALRAIVGCRPVCWIHAGSRPPTGDLRR